MLAWLVDNANLVYVALGMIVLALGVSWWLDRRVRTLIIAAGVAALIALFWLLTLIVPTDRKQIEANLWAMTRAVIDKKPDDLVKHWTGDFSVKDLSRRELAKAVTQASERFKVGEISLWEFDVKKLTDTEAEIWFRCAAKSNDGGAFLALCKADFVKEGEAWKLKRIRFFNAVANTDQEISLPVGR